MGKKKLTDEELERMKKEQEEPLPTDRRKKKVTKTEEWEEPREDAEPSEDELPGEDSISRRERATIVGSEDYDLMELITMIGQEGHEGWKIEVIRQEPTEWDGFRVESGMIFRLRVPTDDAALYDRIEKNHGGGKYLVWVKDKGGVVRRKQTLELDGDPKLTRSECPEYYRQQRIEESQQPDEIDQEVRMLRAEREKAEIRKDINRIEGQPGSGDGTGIAEVLAGVMNTQFQTMSEMRREMADQTRASEDRTREMIRDITDRLSENNSSDPMGSMAQVMSGFMTAMMTMSQQSQQQFQQMMMQMSDQNQKTMQLILPALTQKEDSSALIGHILESSTRRNEMSVDMFKSLAEIVTDKEADEDPRVKLAEIISGAFSDGMDTVKKYFGLRAAQTQAGVAPGLPAPARPAPGPAQPAAQQPQQQPPARIDMEEAEKVFVQVNPQDSDGMFGFLINLLILESPLMPPPEESAFVKYAMDTRMPDFLFRGVMTEQGYAPGWLPTLKDAADAREQIFPFIPAADIQQGLDQGLFMVPDRVAWLNACIEYIRVRAPRPTPPEEAPPQPAEVPPDETVTAPGEPIGTGEAHTETADAGEPDHASEEAADPADQPSTGEAPDAPEDQPEDEEKTDE